jgi:hypothetical protein
MNKRKLHHYWRYIRLVKPWYFLGIAIVLTIVCLFALRSNSEQMGKLRDAVFAADQASMDVEGPLKELQMYVTSHMNTSLVSSNGVYPPIQLVNTYDRLRQEQAAQQPSNGDLYTEAQNYCQAQNPTGFSGSGRVPCIEQYVKDRGGSVNLGQKIPESLYQFDFVSPRWSPDLAGWSMVGAILAYAATVITFIADYRIKKQLS